MGEESHDKGMEAVKAFLEGRGPNPTGTKTNGPQIRRFMEDVIRDTERQDEENESPLSALEEAARSGDAEACRLLLRQGEDPLEGVRGGDMLRWAVVSGNIETCRLAVDAGCDVKVEICRGLTLMHLFAQKGDAEACRILLDLGADPRAKDHMGRDCVAVARREARNFLRAYLAEKESAELDREAVSPDTAMDRRRI